MHNVTLTDGGYSSHLPVGVCGLSNVAASYTYSTVLILLFVISSVENVVIIIVISKYKTLRTRSILLLGLLAKIGFLNSCVVTAVKARMTMDHSDTWYDIFWWIFASAFSSLATIVIVCFERLTHIYFLEKYEYMSKAKICFALLVLCVSPMVLIFVQLDEVLVAIISLVLFLIYVMAVICSLIGMIVILKNQASNVRNMTQEIFIRYQWRGVQTTILIVSSFMVTNISAIVYIAFGFMKRRSLALCATTYVLILTSSIVNPWIYVVRISVIRKHIFKMFRLEGLIRNEISEERRNGTLRIATETVV